MFVSYNAPHWPNEAKPEDIAKFRNVQDGERRVYCAMVYAMDRGIGRILDALKADGLEKDTIIVFLSDNGGAEPLDDAHGGSFVMMFIGTFPGGQEAAF